jgi:DNA replication and repair protein RecF
VRVRRLILEQFRNYSSLELDLSASNIHLFRGPNGSGKTNLIEAIGLLSLTKSVRGRDESDMAKWDSHYYRVRAQVESDAKEEGMLEVVSEVSPRRKKACFVNDVKVGLSQMVGHLPTVTFLPQDLLLFSGAPAERRRFLDQLLCQISPEYLVNLSAYGKIIQQRNALLRKIGEGSAKDDVLFLWDRELAAKGSAITLARLELIETLNATFLQELRDLGESWSEAQLLYERKGEKRDRQTIEAEMIDLLEQSRAKDLVLGSTTVGPHREDWEVVIEGRSLPTFASRGQERVAVLALLFLEVSFLELRRGEKPVVLLDDAFSELDDQHQRSLLDALREYQVILTAVRMPPDAREIQLWDVENGVVTKLP